MADVRDQVEVNPELVAQVRREIGHDGLTVLALLKEVTGTYAPLLVAAPDKAWSDYVGLQRAAAAAQAAIRSTALGRSLPAGMLEACWDKILDACLALGTAALLDRSVPTGFVLEAVPLQEERTVDGTAPYRQVRLREEALPSRGPPLDAHGQEVPGIARLQGSFRDYAQAVGMLVLGLSLLRREFTIRVSHCPDSLWEALASS